MMSRTNLAHNVTPTGGALTTVGSDRSAGKRTAGSESSPRLSAEGADAGLTPIAFTYQPPWTSLCYYGNWKEKLVVRRADIDMCSRLFFRYSTSAFFDFSRSCCALPNVVSFQLYESALS